MISNGCGTLYNYIGMGAKLVLGRGHLFANRRTAHSTLELSWYSLSRGGSHCGLSKSWRGVVKIVQQPEVKPFDIRKKHSFPVPRRTLSLQFSPHAPRFLGIGAVLGALAMILGRRLRKNWSQTWNGGQWRPILQVCLTCLFAVLHARLNREVRE